MAEVRTPALVLRTFDQGESDRLVHLFTETRGRVSAIAKGARRSKRRFLGKLEILTLLDVRMVERSNSSLLRLEGARLVEPYEGLVSHLGRYAVGCQLLEIMDRLTGEREPHPELYRFARGVLGVVSQETPDRLLALLVVTKTLAHLGYRPQLSACASCGRAIQARGGRVGFDARHGGAVCERCCESGETPVTPRLLLALEAGIGRPLRERAGLGLEPADVERAEELLDRFYRFHVGLEMRTTAYARGALALAPLLDADDSHPHIPSAPAGCLGGASREDARAGSPGREEDPL